MTPEQQNIFHNVRFKLLQWGWDKSSPTPYVTAHDGWGSRLSDSASRDDFEAVIQELNRWYPESQTKGRFWADNRCTSLSDAESIIFRFWDKFEPSYRYHIYVI